jgi:hypothetical protein
MKAARPAMVSFATPSDGMLQRDDHVGHLLRAS